MDDIEKLFVSPSYSIREVIICIDANAKGIALVVDNECRLVGTITDGDIRRAILAGTDLELPIEVLLERRKSTPYPKPIQATVGTSDAKLLEIMTESSLRHIPILDENNKVVDLVMLNDLVEGCNLPMRAVIMAGGYGTRLRPLTQDLPKPMLPIGDRPLLELIIEQLRDSDIHNVYLTTHYKGEIIAKHFGDGRGFGVNIHYLTEDNPQGTAGALSLIDQSKEPILVINGDILTGVDFRVMLDFHSEYQADMTVAVRQYEIRVPYGVIDTDGVNVSAVSEKPVLKHFINAGIYLLNPEVCRFVPSSQFYNMTELISRLVADKKRVVSFPIREYWMDIGQLEDYKQAQIDIKTGEVK